MKPSTFLFASLVFFASSISHYAIAGIAIADCPKGYHYAHFKAVGHDSNGYITFVVLQEKDVDLNPMTRYYLSNYSVYSDWGKPAFILGEIAVNTGFRVAMYCNGKYVNHLALFNRG